MDTKKSNHLSFKTKNKFDENFKKKVELLTKKECFASELSEREKLKHFRKNIHKLLSSSQEESLKPATQKENTEKYKRVKGRNINKIRIKLKK